MAEVETSETGSDGWSTVDGEVGHLTLRMSVKCEHCGQPVPINGPARKLKCEGCLETTNLRGFTGALNDARKGMQEFGSPYDYQLSKHHEPECLGCGERLRFGVLLKQHGATTTVPCSKCEHPSVTYPVPSWLRGQFHGALQIFGGSDPSSNGEQGSEAINVKTDAPKPVLMSCPGCGGGLKIGVEAERTTSCEYCSASVFIPDALWKTLHPAKTKEYWTISFKAKPKRKKKKAPQPKATDADTPQKSKQSEELDKEINATIAASAKRKNISSIVLGAVVVAVSLLAFMLISSVEQVGDPIEPTGELVTEETFIGLGSYLQVEHDGKWYEARVIEVNDNGSFRVHYDGWESRHDENVTRDRIRLEPLSAPDPS